MVFASMFLREAFGVPPADADGGAVMARQVFSPVRRTPRFAPTRPVTVAISHHGVPTGFGIVANLSEGGACVQTRAVPQNREVEMMLSFYEGVYLQAHGRVVWSAPGDGLATLGIEFTEMSPEATERLKENLGQPVFDPV